MEREKVSLLYDLLDEYYYKTGSKNLEKTIYVDEENDISITVEDCLILFQEKLSEELKINDCWFIKKMEV